MTLPSDTQIQITRVFDAPKHLVYKAWTTPELVKRWWHANRGEMTVCDIDLRVGGAWRYVMVAEGFGEVGFHGEYREIVPNERLVSTEVFEGIPDAEAHAAVDTLTLTEVDRGWRRACRTRWICSRRSRSRCAESSPTMASASASSRTARPVAASPSLTLRALKRDTGTISGNWKGNPGRDVMRDGQEVSIFNGGVWTLTGKRGTLTIRERNEWVSVGNGDDVAMGTWKVMRGTGQYAGIVGKGRSGHAGLGSPWYARYEGFLSSP